MEFLVLPQHIIHTVDMADLLRFKLGITSRDNKNSIRVLTTNTMNHLSVLMISRIGDRAGVDDAYIGRFTLPSTGMPPLQKGFG